MNLQNAKTFETVRAIVAARAAQSLPDRVVRVSDLRMSNDGHVVAPGAPDLRLNDWSRAQLGSLLGIRWQKWFATATPAERAEEVSRRLARTPGELKVRAWRDATGAADGVARAFLAPTFTPIDDVRIFDRMHTMLRGLMDEYRFSAVVDTDSTTHYTAVHASGLDVDGRGDLMHPGFHLRNSEVGASALSLDDHWLRLVCSNGLMVRVGGKRALYRTHRAIEDDQLAAALVIAVGRLPQRSQTSLAWLRTARELEVPHPDAAIAAVLADSAEVPRALVAAAQQVVLRDDDRTRFGVVQAITYVAHEVNRDPDVRFAMERLAGDYLAAAGEGAAAAA